MRIVMMDLLPTVPYYTGHLCAALREHGTPDVVLASIDYRHDPDFFKRSGVSTDPCLVDWTRGLSAQPAVARRFLRVLEYLVNLGGLLIRLAVSRPDVVHVQFLPLADYGVPVELWVLRLVRAMGMKIVYTVHNVVPQDSGDRRRRIFRRIYGLADQLICHDSEAASRLGVEFGVPVARLTVIPHGLLFDRDARAADAGARKRLGFGDNECVVLWHGIVRPYKGVSFLLRVWRDVCARDPNSRLTIAGTGDERLLQAIRDEVAALGLEGRVRLELRFVSVAELTDFLEAADILVYPYREITTSGALLTGIAHGKAIVASALPAFEQVLRNGENAVTVPYGDARQWTEALHRMIGDPVLRRTVGDNLRQSQARSTGWPEIARRTCECYEAVMRGGKRWNRVPVRT